MFQGERVVGSSPTGGARKKELYQNDYSDRVAYSSDFMSQNAKKRKKTPPKGAKSKGYTALAKKYSDLNGFKPKVCREVENRCDCSEFCCDIC